MPNFIKEKIQLFFNTENISIKNIVILSIFSFYTLLNFYASKIFYQFSIYEIFFLSLIFLILLCILVFIFDNTYFKEKINFNIYNILGAIIILFILAMIANTALIFIDYYRTFPLLEAELGLDAHPDTSFHISMIQSIISNGYPSTGQHGSPIVFYHIVSHYFDALILLITRMDPYDSYGLFYYYKVFLLLASILIFLGQVIKNQSPFILIFSFLIIAPMLTAAWSASGSHALWMTSIIIILSTNKVFTLLTQHKKNSLKDLIYLFILVLILSMGKISIGFMYATFIGMYLLLKQVKDFRVYFMGIGWIIFFLLFQKLLLASQETSEMKELSLAALYDYFINISLSQNKMLSSIYTSIFILFILFLLFRTGKNLKLLISSLFSFCVLGIIITISNDLIPADIYYFEYSLAFILILFMFQNMFQNIETISMKTIALVALVFLSNFYYLSKFNILNIEFKNIEQRLQSLNYTPFNNINKKLSLSDKVNLINGGIKTSWLNCQERPLYNFRKKLNEFLIYNKIDKKNILLFIPKEIYEKDFYFIKKSDWSKGLFMYAMTGIPLIYANKELRRGYGYKNYSRDTLWTSKNNFSPEKVCNMKFSGRIIILQNFIDPKFTIIDCNNTKLY